MNLMDAYVSEVGRRLPQKGRADIEAEIRSALQDLLDERSRAAGKSVDDDMTLAVLKEYGDPEKVAASYQGERYLIGPRLYPTFMLVMRILVTLIGVIALVKLGVALTAPGVTLENGLPILGSNIVNFMVSALSALGNLVFVFAILEWALPKTTGVEKAWDPRSLRKSGSETEKPVRPFAILWEIAFTIIVALLFNLYPQWIGVGYLNNGQWTWLPLLSDNFYRYMPLINISWGLQIALNVLLLRAGRWERGTRWFKAALHVLSITILAILISGAPIIYLPLKSMGLSTGDAQNLETLAYTGFRALLIFIAVMEGIDLAKLLLHLLYKKEQPVVIQ